MNGTVPGRTMLERIFNREAEKLRATRMKRASLVFTPDWVLIEDRNDRAEENDHDLRPDADAEPDDDERQQGDARHRVERVDERAEHVLQRVSTVRSQAERNADHATARAVTQNEFDVPLTPRSFQKSRSCMSRSPPAAPASATR